MRPILITLIICIVIFTMLDHGMRLDQLTLCQQGDLITCPTKLWWFL